MPNNDTRYYQIGGLVWQINGPAFCENEYMAQFRCEPNQADECYDVRLTDKITLPILPCLYKNLYEEFFGNEVSYARVIYQEREGGILFKDKLSEPGVHKIDYYNASLDCYSNNLTLKMMDIPRRILFHDGIFLHASYVVVDGQAVLFTAPKQTGKSTQAELWRKTRGADIINGDRVILRKIDGVWCACSSPYCGTSKICHNVTAPIKAIVILGQSKKNAVRTVTAHEGLAALLDGCTYDVWDKKQVDTAMTIMEQIITGVPMVRLDCLPDESAVKTLEEFLWHQKKA